MKQSKMEKIFEQLNIKTEEIVNHTGMSRLESLAHALYEVEDTGTVEDKRKAFQFSYLMQMQKETIQPNHQMTPDSIGYIFAHILKLFNNEEGSKVLDIGSGTGHLSLTIQSQLKNIESYGVEIDPSLAQVNVDLCEYLKMPMNIYPQNAMEPLLVNHMDAAIGDLPIGYYPAEAPGFKTAFETGQSFSHLLMIESAMRYVKDGGIGVFIVPRDVLEKNNDTIKKYLTEDATLLMFLNLPKSIFKNENSRKSIMVIEKGINPIKNNEVLLGDIPEFKNQNGIKNLLEQLKTWYDNYAKK